MDMDMDIGWCLTCSKRTPDQRSPYCSGRCREADTNLSTPATEPLPLTSPLPPKLIPLPPTSSHDGRPAGRLSISRADGLALSGTATPTSPSGNGYPRQRDRRAFSFPASEEECRPAMPSFNRKPKAVNATGHSLRRDVGGYVSPGGLRLSTGTNTPNDSSAIGTSDSEREEQQGVTRTPKRPPFSPLASCAALHPAPPLPTARHNTAAAPTSHGTSFSSQLQTARPSLEVRTASPVARMGSSSSRSREDIISWARAVDARGEEGTVRPTRGRTRRPEAFANLTPPSTEPLDEPVQNNTPRSAGALNALNMTFNGTLAPVVNALRSVSLVSSPRQEDSSQAALQSTLAAAEVSRVDVVVATRNEDTPFHDAATPTLSTMSLSEAVDTSNATDLGETIETVTDDFSVTSSHYRQTPPVVHANIHPEPVRRKSTLPLRPSLQQTAASALWTVSSYIRSLAPFATPFSLAMTQTSSTTQPSASPAPVESEASTVSTPGLGLDIGPVSTAVPAAPRSEMTAPVNDPSQNLVRSVPMDIVIAIGSKAHAITEERAREREVIEYLAHSRSRSRNRSRERHRTSRHSSPANSRNDSRNNEDRGRRRTRRRDSRERDEPTTPEEPAQEERGRRRNRGGESRDRSWSAARGRTCTSRTRTAAVRA